MPVSGSRLRHDSHQVSPDPFLELGLGSLFLQGKVRNSSWAPDFLGYIYNFPRLFFFFFFTAFLQFLEPEK